MLPALSSDVSRAEASVREGYESGLARAVEAVAGGVPLASPSARTQAAWVLLSFLTGAVELARAVSDPMTADAISSAACDAILGLIRGWSEDG